MYQHAGQCECGAVNIEFTAPKDLSRYASRQCDCDYCSNRGIEYLSDPLGTVAFISKVPLQQETQGSEQATFMLCSNCQSVLGVGYLSGDLSLGSVNATLLDKFELIKEHIVISPKRLDRYEKVRRWRELWSELECR